MGIIIGKLRRKKTTVEVLEKIDSEIKDIEEYRRNTEQSHKRIVGRFIVISVGIYLVTAFLFYFYFFPATFYDRLFYIIPLILAPVIILTVRHVLTRYYKWKISRKQTKLGTLREEKKKMLEKVMETETYKVAKSILEKFAEPTIRRTAGLLSSSSEITPVRNSGTALPPTTAITGGLRQRALPAPNQQLIQATPSRMMVKPTPMNTALRPEFGRTPATQSAVQGMAGTPLPMPRSILPRDRSVFDKMVDYLVGDGPMNRYALICKTCSSHNGMAFREEFEYISFRCCYCFTFNPARKQRPAAPKLEFELNSPHSRGLSDTSGSEKNSPSDTESESDTLLGLKPTKFREVARRLEDTNNVKMPDSSQQSEPIPMELDMSLDMMKSVDEQTGFDNERKVEPAEERKESEGGGVNKEDEAGGGVGIVKD